MDDVCHVRVLWLGCGTVRGHMEVAGDLVDAELALEATADSVVQWDLHGVVNMTHLMSAHLILDIKADQFTVQIG